LEYIIGNRAKEEVFSQLNDFFGKNLISIVLFGSQAKGKARLNSDIDILVIVKNLSRNWREQDELAGQLRTNLWQKDLYNIQFILTTPEQIDIAIEWFNPLFLSLADGCYVLLGSSHFSHKIIKRIKTIFKIGVVKKRDELMWEIPQWRAI
jgi:predicted nucleotidyltransferase